MELKRKRHLPTSNWANSPKSTKSGFWATSTLLLPIYSLIINPSLVSARVVTILLSPHPQHLTSSWLWFRLLIMLEAVPPLPALVPIEVPLKNSKWESFATAYIDSENGADAARAIGTTESCAPQEARRLLSIPDVKARIAYLESEQRRKALITEGLLTEELAIIAFSNPLDYITANLTTDPEVISVKPGVDPKQIRAIAEVEVKDTAAGVRTVKFKLHSKTAALQMAMNLKGYGPTTKPNGANGTAGVNGKKDNDSNETPEEIFRGLGLAINDSRKKTATG